ncbi:hypothetical protein HZP50_07100 [Elizabethkingia anophelis]|nr:hypothetical protein [Elizabethkingia anophelis]
MKREILFRGKRQDNNEWVYGSLNTKDIHHGVSILTNGVINSAVKPETVGQYTGLLDKNGNKIFEGDECQIMRMKKNGFWTDNDPVVVGYVEFGRISVNGNDLSVFNAFHINERSIEYLSIHELEVIGNIHETNKK